MNNEMIKKEDWNQELKELRYLSDELIDCF